jgi:hypothetical protein
LLFFPSQPKEKKTYTKVSSAQVISASEKNPALVLVRFPNLRAAFLLRQFNDVRRWRFGVVADCRQSLPRRDLVILYQVRQKGVGKSLKGRPMSALGH